MERDDIGFATREGHYVAMKRIIPPVGEARDDYAVFGDLAVRLGVAETFTEDRDTAAWLEHIYEDSRAKAAGMDIVLPPFATFWERSEEHTSELQSLMRNSYAVFCLHKKNS